MAPYLTTVTNGPIRDGVLHDRLRAAHVRRRRSEHAAGCGPIRPIPRWPSNGSIRSRRSSPSSATSTGPTRSEQGGIVDWAPDVGYALESQTRANYHRIPDPPTVVHEVSHQWFGNAVTPESGADIWLNEGFATFSEWIYDELHGGPSAADTFAELYAIPEDDPAFEDLWFPAPAALDHPSQLFHTPGLRPRCG